MSEKFDVKLNDAKVLKLAFAILRTRRKYPNIYPEAAEIARSLHRSEHYIKLEVERAQFSSWDNMMKTEKSKLSKKESK